MLSPNDFHEGVRNIIRTAKSFLPTGGMLSQKRSDWNRRIRPNRILVPVQLPQGEKNAKRQSTHQRGVPCKSIFSTWLRYRNFFRFWPNFLPLQAWKLDIKTPCRPQRRILNAKKTLWIDIRHSRLIRKSCRQNLEHLWQFGNKLSGKKQVLRVYHRCNFADGKKKETFQFVMQMLQSFFPSNRTEGVLVSCKEKKVVKK